MTDKIEDKILNKEEYVKEFGSEKGFGLYLSRKNKIPEPFYNSYGLIKTKDGYIVHTMKMHGKKVLEHSYTEVEPKNFALNKLLSQLRAELNEDD